jgi:excisionase family DNA binding protein
MTFEENLDKLLLGLSISLQTNSQPEFSNAGFFFDKICDLLKMDVSAAEKILLKNKLLADGHIEFVRKDIDYPLIKMTARGLDFIINGGYLYQTSSDKAAPDETATKEIPFEQIIIDLGSTDKNPDRTTETGTVDLMNITQAAKLLDLSKSSIYALTHLSKIPFYKRGKRLYFSEEELIAWVKAGRKITHDEIIEEAKS